MPCCARSREGLDVVVGAARHELKVEDRGDLQRGVLGARNLAWLLLGTARTAPQRAGAVFAKIRRELNRLRSPEEDRLSAARAQSLCLPSVHRPGSEADKELEKSKARRQEVQFRGEEQVDEDGSTGCDQPCSCRHRRPGGCSRPSLGLLERDMDTCELGCAHRIWAADPCGPSGKACPCAMALALAPKSWQRCDIVSCRETWMTRTKDEIDSTLLIAIISRADAGSRALHLVWLPNRLVYSAGLSPTCFAPLSRSRIVSVWKDVFICFFSVTPQRKPVQDSATRRGEDVGAGRDFCLKIGRTSESTKVPTNHQPWMQAEERQLSRRVADD
ncbi:hypothetical protein L1887_53405 [Cichorium endivia]|nr:hypothetical protein L1887_53405 [Cichorium endivia]